MEAAGITLMRGDPRLVTMRWISRRTGQRSGRAVLGFLYNTAGHSAGGAGAAQPGDYGRSHGVQQRGVVLNALTLGRYWRGGAAQQPRKQQNHERIGPGRQGLRHHGQNDPSLRSVGLLPPTHCAVTGYRQYGEREVHVLRFIRRARAIWVFDQDISGLLSLWHDRQRPSRQVKALAQAHMQPVAAQRSTNCNPCGRHWKNWCNAARVTERPDCPILQDLAGS